VLDTERFVDQVVVITGGVSGIGRATAERLAREGARVSIWDADEAGLAECDFAQHRAVFDQSSEADVARLTAEVIAQFGRIDALVVSAGITGPNLPILSYPGDAWRRVMDVNINGAFYCNRAAGAHMVRQGYGRIVNIASIAGKEGNPNASAYSSSKAAVIGLTKSFGKELAETGVTVNCVTPAAVHTPIFEQMKQEHIDYMLSKIPMRRFGTVDEIASLICWIASKECSFSTGAVFDVSGGRATY
jgi:NAD(P)-dependent dehydrogenase (short-subunit alcohol dehydrogenase family)